MAGGATAARHRRAGYAQTSGCLTRGQRHLVRRLHVRDAERLKS
jgi:hypothetical protein